MQVFATVFRSYKVWIKSTQLIALTYSACSFTQNTCLNIYRVLCVFRFWLFLRSILLRSEFMLLSPSRFCRLKWSQYLNTQRSHFSAPAFVGAIFFFMKTKVNQIQFQRHKYIGNVEVFRFFIYFIFMPIAPNKKETRNNTIIAIN